MFGCIDPGNTPAPTVDDVKRRVAGALDYLDPAKVMLSPDCGLMTISRDLAREKLKVMVAAAQRFAEGDVSLVTVRIRTRPGRGRSSPTVRGRCARASSPA